jgi:hypothetical protein
VASDISFDDLIPAKGSKAHLDAISFDDLIPKKAPSVTDAITDIPSEIGKAFNEGYKNLTAPTNRGQQGQVEGFLNTGKAVLGVPQMLLSPVTGAARSVLGHGLEQATHAAGTVIAPEIAANEDRQKNYETAKGDVDLALAAAASRGGPRAAPTAPVSGSNEVVAAADRLAASGNPVEVPNALASDSMIAQRTGQAIRNVPIVGDAIPKATARLTGQLEEAAGNVASEFGGGSGPNVAHKIGETLTGQAQGETQAAKSAAAQSDAAVLGDWERSVRNTNEAITGVEQGALQRARQSLGDMSPQDMGETLIARLRQGEREAYATKERLYGAAGESDGSIAADAVRGARSRIAGALDHEGYVIDGQLTPAANRMITELDNISSLRIPNRVASPTSMASAGDDVSVAAVNMQGIEQTRKRLNSIAQTANNDGDRRAARAVMREFDNWLGDAFDDALFSGSEAALQSFRAARAANTEWRQRFGFNARDDADRVVNRIVTGEVTPQEVANYVVGASKVGSKGVSSRLLTRIAEATGGDPEAMNAIRSGVWNRLSQSTEGVTAKNAGKVADDIGDFLNGSGRDVANRLFSEPQRGIMRAYADTIRAGAVARESAAEIAANTKPGQMEVGIGPFQQLAKAVLGGGRSDEALYSAINSYAKSGSKGDINLLSKVLKAIPESERGNLASAMVRDMGVSPRTGQFSPDVFVSAWNTYRPEAKALLFGMSGPQRRALDDIAIVSQRMKDVGSKFGNPSGTAQNVNFFALASSFFAAPLTTLASGLGGAVVAKLLASPAGAVSVSRWSKAYERVASLPSVANQETLTNAASMLAINVSRETGAPIKDLMRQLQGPVPAAADSEKNRPGGVRNAQPY